MKQIVRDETRPITHINIYLKLVNMLKLHEKM